MSEPSPVLTELLRPVVASAGCDLEELRVERAGRRLVVRVVVDADSGVSLDDVAEVSRAASAALDGLDAADPSVLAGAYVLEVSSPGVDRPLTLPRHWRRNVGRLVKVVRTDGESVVGRLAGAEDDAVVLRVDAVELVVPLADVRSAQVQVEFSREAAAESPGAGGSP